jgi:hypothetical protein
LKETIRENLLSDIESINFINKKSLKIRNIIYKRDNPFKAKLTAEIEVLYSYNFLSNINNYTKNLKSIIS